MSKITVKDIVERNGIEREDVLNDILDFLASQISSLTNPTNIANAIASMKNEKINPAMVSNYVQYVIDSFLISMAKRYDVKGKTYFKYPNKYYYTDIGLRNARLNYRQYDPGHTTNFCGAGTLLMSVWSATAQATARFRKRSTLW